MRPRQALLLAALGLALAAPLLAGEAKPATAAPAKKPGTATPAKKPGPPIHLWADRIRYLHQQHRAMAKGNVTIIQDDFRIDCDDILAVLDPKTNNFQKITATGHVRIHTVKPLAKRTVERPKLEPVKGGRSGTCAVAEYDPVKEIVILKGTGRQQPVIVIGEDRVRGDVIRYDRKNDQLDIGPNAKIDARIPESAAPIPATTKPATSQPPK